MRVIVAGGRDLPVNADSVRAVKRALLDLDASEVVSGGATGGDEIGERAAVELDLPVKRFRAFWRLHGIAAGPIRNEQMANYAQALVALPGGKGTADMIAKAKAKGLRVALLDLSA